MRESKIESYFIKLAKLHGGLTRKYVSPSHKGVPDRIYIKAGKVYFIEFKSSIGKASKLQLHEHELMAQQGVSVYLINSIEKIEEFFKEIL